MNVKTDHIQSGQSFGVACIYLNQYYDQLVACCAGDDERAREEFDNLVGIRLGFSLAKNYYYYYGSLQKTIFHFVAYLEDHQSLEEGLRLVAAHSGLKVDEIEGVELPPAIPQEIWQLQHDPYPGAEIDQLRLAIHSGFHPWRLAYIVRTVGNIRPGEISTAYHYLTWAEIVEYIVGVAIEQGWLDKLRIEAEKFNPRQPYADYPDYQPELPDAENKFNELFDRLSRRIYSFGRSIGLESQHNIVYLVEYLRQKYDWHSLEMMLRERCEQDLEKLTGLGQDVSELVDTAKMEGWLNDLVAAAHGEKPDHPAIAEIFSVRSKDTETIKYALLSGFDKSGLVKLVRTLDRRWSAVTSAQTFFKAVIQHAEDHGWLPQLLHATHQDKPKNPQIEQVYHQYFYVFCPEILLYQTIVQKLKPEDFAYFVRTGLNKNNFGYNGQEFAKKVAAVIVAAYRENWLTGLMHALHETWPGEETLQRLVRQYPISAAPSSPPVSLTGADIERLLNTLLRHFNYDDLRMMLFTRLELKIESLSLNSDLRGIVFDLLAKSQAQGWVDKLLAAAAGYLPENEALRQELAAVYPRLGVPAAV